VPSTEAIEAWVVARYKGGAGAPEVWEREVWELEVWEPGV
jgi:hypothetical protein